MVVPGGSATRILETLPQRPPTPPRESENAESRPSLFSRIFSKGLGAQTPPNISPKSSAESVGTPPDRSHKKVGWSTSTDYNEPPEVVRKNSSFPNQILRPLPPSSDRKPPKSILKPYNGVIPVNRTSTLSTSAPPHTYASFAIMLESITRQLAGEDRMSRLDAYMSLSGVLKATENIPDPKALKDKMGLLTQFIQRDMTARSASGAPDTILINNSLILLASLLWKAESLPHDFCIFVLEHCIASFEDPSVSKDVAKHLMFIAGQQDFSPKIMTPERALRLLKASHQIEQHVKGKSIVLGRLGIYRKLLKQARPSMISNTDWVEDLFEDMLTSVKDVRNPVIAFGIEAAAQLGTESKVSRAVMELFQAPHEKGKYIDYFTGRLNSTIQAKQDVACVPQMWSVVILFLRSRSSQLEQWEFLKPWLQILQKCFNSSDPEVKAQANFSWNRLVFAIQPDEKTNPMFVKMLHQPFLGQLKRKNVGKHAKEAFQVTTGSICNLLYYTMKPGAPFAQLDLYWDAYVSPLVGKLLAGHDDKQSPEKGSSVSEGPNQAIAILQALLDPSRRQTTTSWKIDRAMSTDLMQADELSLLDSKWIRKNCERVLDVLEPVLAQRFADLGANQSPVRNLWKAFLLSVAAAGAREIKVSNETMACVAKIFTLLNKFWHNCPQQMDPAGDGEPSAFLDSWVYLLTESITVLGVLPFTEKKLSIGHQNTFAVVATPSTNSGRTPQTVKSPIQYLITFFAEPTANIQYNTTYMFAIRQILKPFLEARTSWSSKIEFCQDLVQCLPSPGFITNRAASETVWCVLSDLLATTLKEKDDANNHTNASSGSHSQPLGANFRNLDRVLEYGLISLFFEATPDWETLFHALSDYVKSEAGDGGQALCVIDPLARSLRDQYISTEAKSFVRLCSTLVKAACYPVDAQSLEAARRKLWGSVPAGPKSSSFDPYRNLYGTINFYLEKSYEVCDDDLPEQDALLSSVADLVRRCPDSVILNLLVTIGDGVAMRMENARDSAKFGDPSTKWTLSLWEVICSRIAMMHQIDSNVLFQLQSLISAALCSKHKLIVTSAINLWNRTFGMLCDLKYPEEVAKSLMRLRSVADLNLPNFPDLPEDQSALPAPQFLDSDEDSEPFPYNSSTGPRSRDVTPYLEVSPLPGHGGGKSPGVGIGLFQSASKKRMLEVSQSTRKHKLAKKDTTPRLRHDDSQIQFAAIESSPAADDAIDSQLLTERQREVKERQKSEAAAMFPDLRSSPRPKAKKTGSKLSLSSDLPVSTASEEGQPATPSINHTTSAFDDFITSSPTPRREIADAQLGSDALGFDSDAADPPSSPPKAASRESSPLLQDDAHGVPKHEIVWDGITCTSDSSRLSSPDPSILSVSGLSKTTDLQVKGSEIEETGACAQKSSSPERTSTLARAQSLDEQTGITLKKTFVDALSNPGDGDEGEDPANGTVYVDAASFPQPEVPALDNSSRRSARSGRSKRNQQTPEKENELPTSQESATRRKRRSSSLSELDEDADEIGPGSNATALKLDGGKDFQPEACAHVAGTPRPKKLIKTRKRRSGIAILLDQQHQSFMDSPRSGVATRGSEKRNSSVSAVVETSPLMENVRSRASSRLRHEAPAAIPETPVVAEAGTEKTRKQPRQSEITEQSSQSQPAKRRRVERSESRVVVEDSQEIQPAPIEDDAMAGTLHHRPPRRGRVRKQNAAGPIQEKEPDPIPKDRTPRVGKRSSRGRGRPIKNKTVQVKEEMEIESSPLEVPDVQASIDLDAKPLNPEQDSIYVEDSFMGVPDVESGESRETDGEKRIQISFADHLDIEAEDRANELLSGTEGITKPKGAEEDDAGSAGDAEAEAQIMELMSQAEASRDRAPSSADEPQPPILAVEESADGKSQCAGSIVPTTAAPLAARSAKIEEESEVSPNVSSGSAPADTAKEEFTGAIAVSRFKELLEGLQTTTMSRAEVMKMEEMMWDLKAELYAAEKRGRSA